MRSLITLKMLTYQPTGGIVAAATTSLPESIGGVRNWDYRYCWIRDATLTLYALLSSGYRDEARAWREWLLRAVAGASFGDADHVRHGRRAPADRIRDPVAARLREQPSGAHRQRRLRTAAARRLRRADGCAVRLSPLRSEASPVAWQMQKKLLDYLEKIWDRPDQGMWEVRGEPRHFTFSKIMCWVAFDRAIKSVDQYGLEGPREHWEDMRDRIAAQILERPMTPSATPSSSITAPAISTPRCC